MTYSGEVMKAENGGDAMPFYNVSLGKVLQMVRGLSEGDTIVINCDNE